MPIVRPIGFANVGTFAPLMPRRQPNVTNPNPSKTPAPRQQMLNAWSRFERKGNPLNNPPRVAQPVATRQQMLNKWSRFEQQGNSPAYRPYSGVGTQSVPQNRNEMLANWRNIEQHGPGKPIPPKPTTVAQSQVGNLTSETEESQSWLGFWEDLAQQTLEPFVNYVLADGWDSDNEGTVVQKTKELFQYVAGVTTFEYDGTATTSAAGDTGMPQLTEQRIKEAFDEWDIAYDDDTTSEELEALFIDRMVNNSHGIDLGDITGKSAEEVLEIYTALLEQRKADRNPYLDRELEWMKWIETSLPANPILTTDVYEWADQANLDLGSGTPGEVEAGVRAYLKEQIYVYNPNPEVDLDSMDLQALNAFYYDQVQAAQGDAYAQLVTTPNYAAYWDLISAQNYPNPLDFAGIQYMQAMAEVMLKEGDVNQQHLLQVEQLRYEIDKIHTDLQRATDLALAFENKFDPAPPDHTLLRLILGLNDVADFVLTVPEIKQNIDKGDWGSAAINAFFAFTPLFNRGMYFKSDDLSVPIQPDGTGGLGNAADDAARGFSHSRLTDEAITAAQQASKWTEADISTVTTRTQEIIERANAGQLIHGKTYHGRLGNNVELEILQNPQAVFLAQNGRYVFWKDGNVVIIEGLAEKSAWRNIVTSYGPLGNRGDSGAQALGGLSTDPGEYITIDDILDGNTPLPGGGTFPPAIPIQINDVE